MIRASIKIFIILIVSVGSIKAFDGKRDGFIASLGIGVHSIRYSTIDDTKETKGSNFGVSSSFIIGFGFLEQFSLYFIRATSWYTPIDHLLSSGITGIGGRYHFLPQNRSWYIEGAIGVGDIADLDDYQVDRGFGWLVGAGYEIVDGISLSGNILLTDIDTGIENIDTASYIFSINYSWY